MENVIVSKMAAAYRQIRDISWRPTAAFKRCLLNKGAFIWNQLGGGWKWSFKTSAHLIAVAIWAGWTELTKSKNFKTLASLCSWAGPCESYLVAQFRRQVFSWCGLHVINWTVLTWYIGRYLFWWEKTDYRLSKQIREVLEGRTIVTVNNQEQWLPCVWI